MPRLDGTGPAGRGAMTGRGMGNCIVPVGKSSIFVPQAGRGMGMRRGMGRGMGMGRGRGFGAKGK